MLTRELMAYVGLWILWGNTLLVAISTARRALFWLARARAWRGGGAVSGEALAGEEGLAVYVVRQNGRLAAGRSDKPRVILWHDRSCESHIHEGSVVIDDTRVTLPHSTQVWPSDQELEAAARCASPEAFERAYADARRVKGFARVVSAPIRSGQKVWLIGNLETTDETGKALTLAPDGRGDCVVSSVEPVALARKNAFLAMFGFLPGMFAVAALCTMLAMTEPVFDGWVSKLGGLASVLYFLLVLPAGTMLRDAVRDPCARALRGRWLEPRTSPASQLLLDTAGSGSGRP